MSTGLVGWRGLRTRLAAAVARHPESYRQDFLSDRDYESTESSLSSEDRSSVASQTSDDDDFNEWILGRDLAEEANNGALYYLDQVFRRRVSVQHGYEDDGDVDDGSMSEGYATD